MVIERINKIKNHRIFQEFFWPHELYGFKEKNLLYGWNGTGKSTLSNLFRSMEKRTDILEGEVEFFISGNKVNGATLSAIQKLPQVRVFNKEFITDNIFTSHGSVAPILFLGEENIEKQKQVEKLKDDLGQAEHEEHAKDKEKRQAENSFDEFNKERAKSIKELLSSSGRNNQYNNYDKRIYQVKCEALLKLSDNERKSKILDESSFDIQKTKKETHSLEKLPLLELSLPDTQQFTDQVVTLLRKTVVSKVIETLKNDQELSGWVQTGLTKHKKEHSNDCFFCGQTLPDGRIQELEAHFNDNFNTFIDEIETLSETIKSAIYKLESFVLPSRAEFYIDLRNEFDARYQDLSIEVNKLKKYLKYLLNALEEKTQRPFQSIEKSFDIVLGNKGVIFSLNAVIGKHNQETEDFKSTINKARIAIEESLVAQNLKEYQQKKKNVDEAKFALNKALEKLAGLKKNILDIEKDIEEHRRPADELNDDICSYLGRDELTFEIKGTGYQICRNGSPAKNLSEGEKTAISFLYFLKSLSDKSFSLKNGIVVIDDPISSLDSNALFHAFGFMKEKTKDAGQLFILTHSHAFFRQVKNWFNHLPNQNKKNLDLKPGRFYMLTSIADRGTRSSSIIVLDRLLHEYESEYHYLFSLVYEAANYKTDTDLQKNYHLSNIARRLLESFLAFRIPSRTGDLRQQLDFINFNMAKKTRILRFLHTYSHAEQISDPEHDPSILIETKQVLNDLLCLIEDEDKRHFDQMKELIKK